MDHESLLRAVETSDCTVFIEWYEKTQSQVNNTFYVSYVEQEFPNFANLF
jgi:hypothetical protein